jgi:hypothetical protein
VRLRWLSLCTVWSSHSQISSISTAILSLGKAVSRREPNLGCKGADRPGWCDAFPKKSLQESCRMGRRIIVMKLICPLGHCECDGHTLHKLSQRRLTADWLDQREGDCSRMSSEVSSDWLPSYIKDTRPVLEILKMAGYFPDSSRNLEFWFQTWRQAGRRIRLREDDMLIAQKGCEGVNWVRRILWSVVKEDRASCRSRNGLAARTVKSARRVCRYHHPLKC